MQQSACREYGFILTFLHGSRTSLGRCGYHNVHWHANFGIRRLIPNGQLQSASLLTLFVCLTAGMPIQGMEPE